LHELAETAQRLTGMNVSFRDDCGAQMVDPDAAVHLYRIAQEALNNALRHSRGTTVEIALSCDEESVRLTVTDDGIGLPAKPGLQQGMGMKTMEYRSQALGGTLEVRRKSPGGTLVSCVCNIKKSTP
jgi:signal transduction histidine kinase